MKTLLLVRHADSDWVTNNDNDFQRPLNAQGEVAAKHMGHVLREKQLNLALLMCSAAQRAVSTADLLNKTLALSSEQIKTNDKLYLAEPLELRHQVEMIDDQYDSVILVGHNPGLTTFAGYLTAEHVGQIPPCGVYAVQIDIDTWRGIGTGCGKCLFVDFPQNHPEARVSN